MMEVSCHTLSELLDAALAAEVEVHLNGGRGLHHVVREAVDDLTGGEIGASPHSDASAASRRCRGAETGAPRRRGSGSRAAFQPADLVYVRHRGQCGDAAAVSAAPRTAQLAAGFQGDSVAMALQTVCPSSRVAQPRRSSAPETETMLPPRRRATARPRRTASFSCSMPTRNCSRERARLRSRRRDRRGTARERARG